MQAQLACAGVQLKYAKFPFYAQLVLNRNNIDTANGKELVRD